MGVSSSCAPIITKHRMVISHETVPCPDSIRASCLLVKIDSAQSWRAWPVEKQIYGFEYVSGFTYDLAVEEVQKRNRNSPPWWRMIEVLSKEEYVQSDPPMYNTSWLLIEYGAEGQMKKPEEGIRVTLDFSGFGSISGQAPCNRYFAECAFPDQKRLEISNPGSTRMACLEPEGIMALEAEYLSLLSQVKRYQQEGNKLILIVDQQAQLVYQQISE